MALQNAIGDHRSTRHLLGHNGVQYVAILCGIGGWPGVVANAEIDPRVRNGALGFTGATQDLPTQTAAGSTLLVFALPPSQRQAASGQQPGAAAQAEQPQPNHQQR